jgi:hypothetical protein
MAQSTAFGQGIAITLQLGIDDCTDNTGNALNVGNDFKKWPEGAPTIYKINTNAVRPV